MLQLIEINLYFHSKVVLKHRHLLVTKATEMIDQCKQAGIRPNDTNFFKHNLGRDYEFRKFLPLSNVKEHNVSEGISVSVLRQKDGKRRLCRFH
jgi:hypothetical protein